MAPPLVPGASAEGPPEPGAAAVGAGMFWLGTGQEGSHGSAAKQGKKSERKKLNILSIFDKFFLSITLNFI